MKRQFMLLLMAGILSLSAAAQAPQKNSGWKRHDSAKGKFSVSVPCTFEPSTEAAVAAGEDPYHSCSAAGGYFVVSYSDIGPTPAAKVQTVLDGSSRALIEGIKGKLVSEKKITLGSIPGREMVVSVANGKDDITYKWRLFVAGARLYAVGVGTLRANAASPNVDAFLTSFAAK